MFGLLYILFVEVCRMCVFMCLVRLSRLIVLCMLVFVVCIGLCW